MEIYKKSNDLLQHSAVLVFGINLIIHKFSINQIIYSSIIKRQNYS